MKSLLILMTLYLQGCSQIYYSTWEMLGKQKRDLLRDNVENLADDQRGVHEEVADALTRLRSLYGSPDDKLVTVYDQLKSDYDDAKSKADSLHARVEKVDEIASDLFEEWNDEISKLRTPKYKSDSRNKLNRTKDRYGKLHASMLKSERSLKPVLSALEEQVIYLKHNLNAQALGSIKGEVTAIESEIKTLTASLESSIGESKAFINSLD